MKMGKPHIIAIPFPAQGHMSPMMHLSKMIAAAGFTVSYVNLDSIHQQMSQNWAIPGGLDIRLEFLSSQWSIPNAMDASCMSNLEEFFDMITAAGEEGLSDLIDRISTPEFPVVAIVSDYFLPWSQSIADKHSIPRIVLWSGAATWASIEYSVPRLINEGIVFTADVRKEKPIDWLPGLASMTAADLPYYLFRITKRWIEIAKERSPVINKASWVLVNSFYELEMSAFDALRCELGEKFVASGPLFLMDVADSRPANVVLRTENEECMNWLNKQLPGTVLYISFGSIAVLPVEQFEELAQALESSKQPFLWVIRPELVVGGGNISQQSYAEFCKRTDKQGYIISWAPQLQVLENSAVGGFLTHCGWNSVLESICNGVPMLGWPWGVEQNTNCKLVVEDWKIGARFSKGHKGLFEKVEIERVIKLVIEEEEGKEMKKRILKLKAAGRQAVKDGGQSLGNLKAFLNEMLTLPVSK